MAGGRRTNYTPIVTPCPFDREYFFWLSGGNFLTIKYMSKQKNASETPEKKRMTGAKRTSARRNTAVSANDNQNQVDNNPQTTPGEMPTRKPVTNADEQKKTSNKDSEDDDVEDNVRQLRPSSEEDGGYE
jgi:hypothetical protein